MKKCIIICNTRWGYCMTPKKCKSIAEAIRYAKEMEMAFRIFVGHSVYIEGQYENENDAFDNPKGITVRCVELDCDDCMKTILRLEKPDKKTH